MVVASSMGGRFASEGANPFFPGHGALTGFLKTLAEEWPTVRAKAVDLDPQEDAPVLAGYLLAELMADDHQTEVGYAAGRRVVLEPLSSPLPDNDGIGCDPASLRPCDPATCDLRPASVLLVTGGARGITAEVAQELAERYQPTLLLVGRSPLPPAEESPDTAGLTEPKELKSALIARLRGQGQPVSPSQVEREYERLLKDREMRTNMAAMAQAGASVHYYSVDVCDERAFGALIDDIYQSFGRLDGVIHGAGIIEDKLIKDKAVESFDRVFSTKVESAFILSRHLRPETLRFLVFFSSVAGRFGNRGQADYGAANEVLNKLAIYLDRRWPGRVVSIIWGPWEKRGMVSAELQREFARRGVALIPPAIGRRRLDEEIRRGRKGEAEVIVGNGPWAAQPSVEPTPVVEPLPLLVHASEPRRTGGSMEYIRRLDPLVDHYLRDHQLDGKPVLPLAMAAELMAEVVQQGWPDLVVVALRDLRLLRGIVVEEDVVDLRVVARVPGYGPQEQVGVDVNVEIAMVDQPERPCYRVTVQLAQCFPDPPASAPPPLANVRAFPLTVEEAYAQWLFHGPCFQCITRIEGISEGGMVVTASPSSPEGCLAGASTGRWLIDPILIDIGPQLAILWARACKDMTALPSYFHSYRRFGSLPEAPIRCYFRVRPDVEGHTLHSDVYFVGTDGRLLGLLEGLETSCSKALNRLAGTQMTEGERNV